MVVSSIGKGAALAGMTVLIVPMAGRTYFRRFHSGRLAKVRTSRFDRGPANDCFGASWPMTPSIPGGLRGLFLDSLASHLTHYPANGISSRNKPLWRMERKMSVLDDVAKERQQLTERLAKVDADRAKLAEQLVELEVAERVLSRFIEARSAAPRGRSAAATPKTAAAERRRGRPRRPGAAKPVTISIGDASLRAVETHSNGISAEHIRSYPASEFGLQVRANHLGMALQRHRRAGLLEQRNSVWFPRQPAGGEATA